MHLKTSRVKKNSVNIGDLISIIYRFADETLVNAENEEAADDIVTSMDTACTRCKMEIGPAKTKIMTNKPDGFQREMAKGGEKLQITGISNL